MAFTRQITTKASSISDLRDAYHAVHDVLATLYWQCPDATTRGVVFAAREQVGQILDALNQQQLDQNTQEFAALLPKVQATNVALADLQGEVSRMTHDLGTVAKVVNAIGLALSLAPVA